MIVVSGLKEEGGEHKITGLAEENFIYSACLHPRHSGVKLSGKYTQRRKERLSELTEEQITFQG